MTLARLTSLALLLSCTACFGFLNQGTPCGGTRQVDAQAVLPDTGLGARGIASVSFNESEPNRALDETSLIVWTFPPDSTTFADNTPRVRVVTDNGRVFLDLEASLAYRGSWYVRQPIANDTVRAEIVSAFQAGLVQVEFSRSQPVHKLTRVRPNVGFAGRRPVVTCI